MSLTARIMENTLAYRLWMAPFAEKKFAPILAHNDLSRVRRVLDVGCGPGTNTHHFAHVDYLGVDINPAYIENARQRHHRNFLVADVRNYTVAPDERFDFILLNSFLHHIDKEHTLRILSHLQTLLTEDGHVHVIELVLPERPSIPRFLAQHDRGEFPRPLEEWREILRDAFQTVVFEPFELTALGIALWNKLYFKGRTKR